MAVPAGPTEQRYVGNGVTTIFTVPFLVIQASDLAVYVDGAKLTSGYTQSGVGNPTSSVIFAVAPANLSQIFFSLEVPFERLNDYQENGDFLARTVNNDFDRIWQALKQLYTWATRSLRLGSTDVDGQGWYRAKGNGIRNLHDPVEDQDAVTKLYNEQYIGSLLDQFSGPINNANNVMYIYPNGVPRTVQSLAAQNDPALGSAGIGHNNTTVRQELLDIHTEIDANEAAADGKLAELKLITDQTFYNAIEPALIDLHFGTLLGVGWTASEPGNIVPHTVTGSTSNTITVNNVTGLYVGQLICYQATNGEYYTSIIRLIGTLTLTMTEVLPAPVANGAQLYNFYRDDAHANTYGFNAVCDDALRQLTTKRLARMEYMAKDNAVWTPLLGASLTTLTTTAYDNPGAAAVGERGLLVQSSTVNAGVISRPVALVGGDYVMKLAVNCGTRDGGFSGWLDIAVEETTAEGAAQVIAILSTTLTWGGCALKEIKFTSRPGSTIRVRATSPNGGPWRFWVGPLSFNRVGGFMNNLNRGKHVLLGDSWFTSGGDFHNRLIARLNKATVISAGVPGNRASQLIARFATDVIPQNPDFVWIMVGTNDYYAGITFNDFEQQIHQLRGMIQAIGAQPIFFDATVGSIAFGPEKLTPSRSYALNIRYLPQELPPNSAGAVQRNFTYSGTVTVAAGATIVLAISPGQTRLPAFLRYLTQSITGLTLKLEYSSAADGSGAVDLSTFTGTTVANDFLIPRTDSALRFVKLSVTNGTGSSITAWILADICWQQSLV